MDLFDGICRAMEATGEVAHCHFGYANVIAAGYTNVIPAGYANVIAAGYTNVIPAKAGIQGPPA